MSMEKCRKCRHVDSWEKCEECYEGCNFEGNTNGNKIRAMSDEEKADFFAKFTTICEMCIHINENCMTMSDDRCREGILQWLKSEVKE